MSFRKKLGYGLLLLLGMAFLLAAGFTLGVRVGETRPQTLVIRGVTGVTPQGDAVAVDFGTFWQTWDLIDDHYLNAPDVSANERIHGAIRGLVQSLGDPHSEFFDPEDGQKFAEDVEGNFGGIGAEIGIRNDQIVVIAPLKGTPAERAGLQPNDIIFFVNTTSTDGLAVDEAVRLIRGPKGTEVTLTIFREGWERPREVPIVRETIIIPTLDYEMRGNDVLYVSLNSFNANANRQFYEAVLHGIARGAQGMVLDLRNNPGGYLEVAVDLAGWFVPRGEVVVSEADRGGTIDEFRAEGNAALRETPVVVLVNGGSASASEILAGALRDIRGVKLVGEQTFGKGTVQQIIDLRDGSSMKVTVAHWVLPSGKVLEGEGLKPDIEAKLSEADLESGNDVQLTKALEVLREEMRNRE